MTDIKQYSEDEEERAWEEKESQLELENNANNALIRHGEIEDDNER